MFKKLFILTVLLMTSVVMTAQVTSADISGIVMAGNETAIGATITAKHIPSGSVYRGIHLPVFRNACSRDHGFI